MKPNFFGLGINRKTRSALHGFELETLMALGLTVVTLVPPMFIGLLVLWKPFFMKVVQQITSLLIPFDPRIRSILKLFSMLKTSSDVSYYNLFIKLVWLVA
ncbi:hypothetical protein [Kriegella aquimaris]|uniref:Uncharacterized protein n=1 Tax=Kriegella aquimaris TaxID=192904 RepID=A0A1G9WYR5_9FLAO|nr:hypothetical protein [Kriegella aquimaris]SDM89326.1 hypothetical protein SAMN04488514_116106 [Kriegella aquimaris]